MKLHLDPLTRIIVLVNFLLILPGLYGLFIFAAMAIESGPPVFAFLFLSLLLGIANGAYLFFRKEEVRAWIFHMACSIYALALWVIFTARFLYEAPSFAFLYIWPICMIMLSYRVLKNFYGYQKVRN